VLRACRNGGLLCRRTRLFNQENTPQSAQTPTMAWQSTPSTYPRRRWSSIARSPLSSIDSGAVETCSGQPETTSGFNVYSNDLAHGRRSSTPAFLSGDASGSDSQGEGGPSSPDAIPALHTDAPSEVSLATAHAPVGDLPTDATRLSKFLGAMVDKAKKSAAASVSLDLSDGRPASPSDLVRT
jgi:hypothetical protein